MVRPQVESRVILPLFRLNRIDEADIFRRYQFVLYKH
jgi:hypothetical protein